MLEKMKLIWQDAKQLKDERGLTLVELLVVVVILGIIASIAVVAIGGIIENSKKDAMVADAKQMVNAAKIHTASNPDDTELEFLSGEGLAYISKLNDPFGESYNTAKVSIVKSGTGYSYKVELKGNKTLTGTDSTVTVVPEEEIDRENIIDTL